MTVAPQPLKLAHKHPNTTTPHNMMSLASSIYHPRRGREAAVSSPVPMFSPVIKIQWQLQGEQGEKVLRVGVFDWWMGCNYGGGGQIPTFSALFMDDKAQVINKRRACEASAYLILLMWCWLMAAGAWPVWPYQLTSVGWWAREHKQLFIQVQQDVMVQWVPTMCHWGPKVCRFSPLLNTAITST